MGKHVLPIIVTAAILLPSITACVWVGYYVAHHHKFGAPAIHMPRPDASPRVALAVAYASA